MARGAQEQGYELVPGSVVPQPQPTEGGCRGEASAQTGGPSVCSGRGRVRPG